MSYSDLPQDYRDTIDRYINLFQWIGIDFVGQSKSYLNLNNGKLILFCTVFYPFVLGQFSLIFRIRADNFMETVRNLPVCLLMFQDIVKMAVALYRRSEIRNMILEVGELWPRELETGERQALALKSWLKRTKMPFEIFYIFGQMTLILYEVIPFTVSFFNICKGVDVYLFPLQPTYFWNINSLFTYVVTYLWQVAITLPCVLCLYLPFNLTIMVMTTNVSALFRLLQVDLQYAIKLRYEDRKLRNVSDPVSFEEVKRIVAKHQRVLRIADELSTLFGLVIFIHVVFAALEICFYGFLSIAYGGLAATISNIMASLNVVVTIFLLSLSGQFLCDTSSLVADAAYQSHWYESDEEVKKLILIIMIRAQRPCYLSTLGFSQLTLETFSKIMSSAWTYFSLLIQVYKES